MTHIRTLIFSGASMSGKLGGGEILLAIFYLLVLYINKKKCTVCLDNK